MTALTDFEKQSLREVRRIKHRSWLTSYLMVLPAMAFLIAFVLYPTVSMLIMSLYYGNAKNPFKKWMGLENYNVRQDFWIALRNTAAYTGMALVLVMILSPSGCTRAASSTTWPRPCSSRPTWWPACPRASSGAG